MDNSFSLWKSLVDKSVDNVEKSWFSTAIFPLFTAAAIRRFVHIRMHIRTGYQVSCVLCCHWFDSRFRCEFIEKVGILP